MASLALGVSLRCSVYNDSLLGTGESNVAGRSTLGLSGSSGAPGGASAGQAEGAAAGEDDGGRGGAGSGGLAETGGSTETGGVTESGGSAGRGGAAIGVGGGGSGGGNSGSGGAPIQAANGCARLFVPLDDAADKAHFVISLASTADLSAATLSMRLYVQAGGGGSLFNYVQDNGTYHFLGVASAQRRLLSSFSGWSTLTWNIGAEPEAATDIDKANIRNVGIEINAQPSSTWSNPTIVYVDSITLTTPTRSFTFDASGSVNPTATTSNTAGETLWQNSGTLDTTATGVTLSWQATCP